LKFKLVLKHCADLNLIKLYTNLRNMLLLMLQSSYNFTEKCLKVGIDEELGIAVSQSTEVFTPSHH